MNQFLNELAEKKLTFAELNSMLSSAPYNLEIKQSEVYKDLFLLAQKKNYIEKKFDECNGLILHKETLKVVARSFPRILEKNEWLKGEFDLNEKEKDIQRVEIYEEGTFLRLFYYNEEWIVSTLKCINSDETFIPDCDLNFTQLFWGIASNKIDKDKLDVNFTYSFILKHPSYRCIINYTFNPVLLYCGRFDNQDFSQVIKEPVQKIQFELDWAEDSSDTVDMFGNKIDESHIRDILSIEDFKLSDMLDCLQEYRIMTDKGYIVTLKDGKRVSLLRKEYEELVLLRGSNPSIRTRYLELSEENRKKLDMHYSECNLSRIPNEILKKSQELWNGYKRVHIHRSIKIPQLPDQNLAKSVYELHKRYLNTRVKVSPESCHKYLESLEPKILGRIMKFH